MRFLHAARARARLLLNRRQAEERMNDEMRFHIEMETARLVRECGLAPDEARRRALVAFGGVDRHKEAMRDGRGLAWVGGLALDLRLGVRMIRKHPGLSLVSVFGMAVAIAIGAGAFGVFASMLDPRLPLHEGDRIVALQNSNVRNPGSPERRALADLTFWRGRLTRVRDVGAHTTERRTLVFPDGGSDLVRVARMNAAGFRVARVAPALGRPLLDDDERKGAPPVLVIAHEEWQRRFAGDPAIVGRQVRLGGTWHTVVGVMPAGFRFPLYHRYWTPLGYDDADYPAGSGPELFVFGRLAPDATLEEARAEIAAVGPAAAAERTTLRPQVMPYPHVFFEVDDPGTMVAIRGIQIAISLLLVVVAVNVAVLVYARTAARLGEIAVRTALGASRRRVVGQLFAEALVLTGLAAVLGLAVARAGLAMVLAYLRRITTDEFVPFWMTPGITPGIVLYTAGLALLAAVIVGVLPALRATGRDVHAGLQQLSSRGSRMQLGRTWTTLIVAQVAIAVAVLPYTGFIAWQAVQRGTTAATFADEEVLRAQVALERLEAPPPAESASYEREFAARFVRRVDELHRRLASEPGVAGVTFASHFPGKEEYGRVEAEGCTGRSACASETMGVWRSRVDPGLLGTLGIDVIAGRGLLASDLRARQAGDARTVGTAAVVNGALAERLRATGEVLGRRVRTVRRVREGNDAWRDEHGPWVEVVGVMPEFVVQPDIDAADSRLYVPAALADVAAGGDVSLAVRVRGGAAFAQRFRRIAAEVDPALELRDLQTAAALRYEAQQGLRLMGLAVALVTGSVLLLSAAGIHAMMAFTVARRRREIGIRAALGAQPRRVLGGIFARAGAQLGLGVAIGVLLAALLNLAIEGQPLSGELVLLLPAAAAGMLVVGLLAALGPARQGLSVQPTEALREE